MLVFASLAFAWIPVAFIITFDDVEPHLVVPILLQLWPLTFSPLCGFFVCWIWRSLRNRQLARHPLKRDEN
jgi:hypothetical protein